MFENQLLTYTCLNYNIRKHIVHNPLRFLVPKNRISNFDLKYVYLLNNKTTNDNSIKIIKYEICNTI